MEKMKYVLVIGFSLFLVTACNQKKTDKPETVNKSELGLSSEGAKRQAEGALETTMNYVKQKKTDYQKNLEGKLNELDSEINELKAKVSDAGKETKAKYDEMIEALQQKQKDAKNKLENLKSASAERWEDFKSGIETALEDLRKKYNEASKSLQ